MAINWNLRERKLLIERVRKIRKFGEHFPLIIDIEDQFPYSIKNEKVISRKHPNMICEDVFTLILSYGTWEEELLRKVNDLHIKKAAKLLVKGKLSLNESKYILKGNITLEEASLNGYDSTIRHILSNRNFLRNEFVDSMVYTCRYNHLSTLSLLVKEFPKDSYLEGALNCCLGDVCTYGYTDIVSYLLSKGASPRAHGDASLLTSAEHGHIDIVRIFLQRAKYDRKTLTYAAVQAFYQNHQNVVDLLVSNGADQSE